MSQVWPYIVSGAAAAIAVAGIAALAEVELWTAMHARVTAVVIVLTGFMHYCWHGYRWVEQEIWFVILVVIALIAARPATHFLGLAPWGEGHLYVTAGSIVATISAHFLWNLWWNADHRYEERMRRIWLAELEAARVQAERERERADAKAAREAEERARIAAQRFESGVVVKLRWSDERRKSIESMKVLIPERDPRYAKHGGTEWVEVEEVEPQVVLGMIGHYREENRKATVSMFERGLDAKKPRWWLEHCRKEVETKHLAVQLNVARTAPEDAVVRSGEFEGKRVSGLTRNEFERLLKVLDREDRRGASYARNIFDATRPGWRPGSGPYSGRRAHVHGKMSVAEARDCLAVSEDASLEEITERGRALRQKNHPDKGGSAKIFRDITEALKVLTDYHSADR